MITTIKGDLLQASEDAIGHGCNCFKTMGAGVAAAIRKKWPAVYQADVDYDDFDEGEKIGEFSTVKVDGKQVYNIYTQVGYKPRSQDHFEYDGFRDGLSKVFKDMKNHGLASLALPKIGAGLAGGDWVRISAIIDEVSNEFSIPVTIYEL